MLGLFYLMIQNLRRINQRKGLCFVQEFSADQNDLDDNFITPYALQDFRPQA